MSEKSFRLLAINPGSTSTKLAVYQGTALLAERTIRHSGEELAGCADVVAEKPIRLAHIRAFLEEEGVGLSQLDAVVGRGGLLKPVESGVYQVNAAMLRDLSTGYASTHASALGGLIAAELAGEQGLPAYVVDPVVVDELTPAARLSGISAAPRVSVFHALNTKAVCRSLGEELGKPYDNCRFVAAHMGGGISVGAHRYGRVIDVSDAFNGEGPFSPERSGSVPLKKIVDMCYSGQYSREEMMSLISGKGGMEAYLGTKDVREAERRANGGDSLAALVLEAMTYQIAKEIGAMAAVLSGRVDAIVLTGGLAYSSAVTGAIKDRVDSIAPVYTYPGEDEMLALAKGALRVLDGEEAPKEYA